MDKQSILDAQALVARHGSIRAAARASGLTYGHIQRRMKVVCSAPAQEKPRFRVKVGSGFAVAPTDKPKPLYAAHPPESLPSASLIRVLAIGDLHDDPYLPKDRFGWIGKHAAAMQPDRIVQIGDICDLESLSFHSPNASHSGRYKPRFMADLQSLDEALTVMFEPMARANVKPRFDLTLGNHENRIWRFEETAPETSGMLQRDFMDVTNRYGINCHEYGKFIHIGGVGFTHAPFSVMGKPIGGMTASQTIGRQAAHDIVSGHTHKANVVTVPRLGRETKVTIIDLGCALPQGYVASYAKHTLTGWSWLVWELLIQHGSIVGYQAIPMSELQRRYA